MRTFVEEKSRVIDTDAFALEAGTPNGFGDKVGKETRKKKERKKSSAWAASRPQKHFHRNRLPPQPLATAARTAYPSR